jgi:hypothetical protein
MISMNLVTTSMLFLRPNTSAMIRVARIIINIYRVMNGLHFARKAIFWDAYMSLRLYRLLNRRPVSLRNLPLQGFPYGSLSPFSRFPQMSLLGPVRGWHGGSRIHRL